MRRHSFFFKLFAGNLLVVGAAVALVDVAFYRGLADQQAGLPGGVLWWSALTAVATAAALGLLTSWIWYSPVRHVTATARNIAAGDFSSRAQIFGTSELAELGTALNEMRESLARQVEMIAARGTNLQQVVSNLHEGVIATSAAGEIVLANQAAIDLLLPKDAPSPVGRKIQSVLRVLDILDLYNRAQASGQAAVAQVDVELAGRRRHLRAEAIPLPPGRPEGIGGLLVLHDVTDIARAAAMKAEFVANASHELRTPLATIRAACDSLAASELDDRQAVSKLVGMLDRHVKRLEDLTRDLLDLHALESGRRALRAEGISIESLTQWLASNFAQAAGSKGLDFRVQAEGSETIFSDRTLVELILQNLVDNAIKFTSAGGRVSVTLSASGESFRLQVSDTGCGIPIEAQGHVFERFFQIDTARSGATQGAGARPRGTGLGLAIVKHATERLGGQVSLSSQPGAGTTVTVILPARQ
jgi:signal transduction histidine kinase